MPLLTASEPYKLFNKDCTGLKEIPNESIHAIITDPPYGIHYQSHAWDKALPEREIWHDCMRVLKPGGFALVFSSIRLMHRLMVNLEDEGFRIKDVLMWAFLNGMPKSRDIGLDIDKKLGVESKKKGKYNYVQGYKKGGARHYYAASGKYRYEPSSDLGIKYKGFGLGIKPCYEPIIMIQKPLPSGYSVAKNMIEYGTGALNLEATRIPYEEGEGKIGHNPHPKGRVTGNILRTESFHDGYDKFFLVPKVRQHAEDFNYHPTLKPVALMEHLVSLITHEESIVLDPFTGSGSTGVASLRLKRKFIGYEKDKGYFKITEKRFNNVLKEKNCNND